MDPREFPTKGNLMLAKNSLALAHQGYDLMDKKRNILQGSGTGIYRPHRGFNPDPDPQHHGDGDTICEV